MFSTFQEDSTSSIAIAVMAFSLCFCVFAQMLGVPVTFWDLDATVDVDGPSFLEEFVLPTVRPLVRQSHVLCHNAGGLTTPHSLLRDHSLFHPPTAPFSSRIG